MMELAAPGGGAIGEGESEAPAVHDVRRLKCARADLGRRLLATMGRNEDIILSMLSSNRDWVVVFSGPVRQLDLAWVASMSPAPLCSHVYRVEIGTPGARGGAGSVAASDPFGAFADPGPGGNVRGPPRDVTWLSDPEAPAILEAASREIALGWPVIEGCRGDLLRRAMKHGGAAFQIEVSEGPAWQPARVQQRRLRLAAKQATRLSRGGRRSPPSDGEGDETGPGASNAKAFIALEAVDGVGGVRVVDLRPATWYHMRLRVTYDGTSAAVGPAVAVATKCGPPDVPTPRPRVLEEPVGAGGGGYVADANLSAATRTLGGLMHDVARAATPPSGGGYRLRVSWARPRTNGYPIVHYVLQQRERVLPPHGRLGARERRERAERERRRQDPSLALFGGVDESCLAGPPPAIWTPWREVHNHLLPECLARAPTRCPASITAARNALGLGASKKRSAIAASSDSLHKGAEPPPRFLAVEFRVAAVNALGASAFSKATKITRHECPNVLAPQLQHGRSVNPAAAAHAEDAERASSPANSRPPALEAALEDLAAGLDFPVSLDVVEAALHATRSGKPPAHAPEGAKEKAPGGDRRAAPEEKKKKRESKPKPKKPSKTDPKLYSPAQRMIMGSMADVDGTLAAQEQAGRARRVRSVTFVAG